LQLLQISPPSSKQYGDKTKQKYQQHSFLILVGNTAGQIIVWELSIDMQRCDRHRRIAATETDASKDELIDTCYYRPVLSKYIPKEPLYVYKAHQVGTNGISALIVPMLPPSPTKTTPSSCSSRLNATSYTCSILICSGGDDQALTTCFATLLLTTTTAKDKNVPIATKVKFQPLMIDTMEGASESALKNVHLKQIPSLATKRTPDQQQDHHEEQHNATNMNRKLQFRVYTVGYEQKLSMWSLCIIDPSTSKVTAIAEEDLDTVIVPINNTKGKNYNTASNRKDSHHQCILRFLSSIPVDVSDVSSLDCLVTTATTAFATVQSTATTGTTTKSLNQQQEQQLEIEEKVMDMIAIGGEGIELLSCW